MINASEIGQYRYCSAAWFLQRCGFKPESESLKLGKKKHIKLGENIDRVERQESHSNLFRIVGYFLLVIGFLLIILNGVI